MTQRLRSGRGWWLAKFSESSVAAKGLFLITVPVFIQLLFLLVFALVRAKVEEDRKLAVHSKSVLLLSLKAMNDYTVGYNRAIIAVISRNPSYGTEGEDRLRRSTEALEELERLTAENPSQRSSQHELQQRLGAFRQVIEQILRASADIPAASSIDRDAKVNELSKRFTDAAQASKEIRELFETFIQGEEALDLHRNEKFRVSFDSLYWLFVVGAVIIILGAWSLHRFFSETFWKRVQAVIRNVHSVARDKELGEPLRGTDELAQIDWSIHTLARELKERRAETELFIYSVSHDLRSPLVNLHGFGEELRIATDEIKRLVAGGSPGSETAAAIERVVENDVNQALHFIKVAVDRMASIIDSLLRLSRAGRVEYKFERIDLTVLVGSIVESLAALIAEKSGKVTVGPLPVVSGDRAALELVFQNLLQNALKYSDPSRPPEIRISSIDEEDNFSTISVRDNGLGIPESALPKLFVAFRRFHPDQAAGDGIGLAISRQTLIRHGGRIRCESRVGSGSGTTFYVSLPTWRDRPMTAAEHDERAVP